MEKEQILLLEYLENPYCENLNPNFSDINVLNPVTKQVEKNPDFDLRNLQPTELLFYVMQDNIYWLPLTIKNCWNSISENQKQQVILNYLFNKNDRVYIEVVDDLDEAEQFDKLKELESKKQKIFNHLKK